MLLCIHQLAFINKKKNSKRLPLKSNTHRIKRSTNVVEYKMIRAA
jgi:hypothetical protein